jgi:glycosyltransferase involved in cell wall biosynthesis
VREAGDDLSTPISIVIPAHDEGAVIGRLMTALADRTDRDEVVVVCDGCGDDTALVVRRFAGVVVIEQTRGGKPAALNRGDQVASIFPRFYVDADVVVTAAALRDVARRMVGPVLAGAPRLRVDLSGASWLVRQYYDIWTRLPYAWESTIGSGVIGLNARGRARFSTFPPLIGDDEFVRRLFRVEERVREPDGEFVVFAPRRLSPLVKIKARGRLGILEQDRLFGPAPVAFGRTGRTEFGALVRDLRRWPSLLVFVGVRSVIQALSTSRALRRQFGGWARDDSSRVPLAGSPGCPDGLR